MPSARPCIISIHAPAKGATFLVCPLAYKHFNFNSRSREGSDTHRVSKRLWPINFNSRSREGSDVVIVLQGRPQHISIHAPAKGATQLRSNFFNQWIYFNSRSREGSDVVIVLQGRPQHISIHAPAKGATYAQYPEGFDYGFQFTLPRRERQVTRRICPVLGKFQFTLPRRERRAV